MLKVRMFQDKSGGHHPWLPVSIAIIAILVLCTAVFAATRVWTRTVNGAGSDFDTGLDIALAPNGDLYVVGSIGVNGADTIIWIRKYAPNGNTKWTKTLDGPATGFDFARGAVVDNAGNLYAVGEIFSSLAKRGNIWIRKYSSSGAKLWTKIVNGPGDSFDSAFEAAVDSADNLYVVGSIWTSSGGDDIWIRKYNSSGDILWTRTVNGPGISFDGARGAVVDSADNLYVVGFVFVTGEGNNIWIRKYNPSGAKLWTRSVDGPAGGTDKAHGAAVDSADNLYVVGEVGVSGTDSDIWIRKYTSSGVKLWTRTASGSGNDMDEARDATVDANGALFVTGVKTLSGDKEVVWLRKYSPGGVTRWTETYTGPDNNAQGFGISVNATNRVYVTGWVLRAGQAQDILVRKYRQ